MRSASRQDSPFGSGTAVAELQAAATELPHAAEAPSRQPGTPAARRMAYLLSRYPAVSHSFLLNEILELRKLGFEIEVASINSADRPADQLPAVEREESETTRYIKGTRPHRIAASILRTLILRPRVFFRGLAAALRLGGMDLSGSLYALFYFAEALLIGEWMMQRRLRHLHVHFCTAVATVGLLTSIAWEIPMSLSVHGPDEFFDTEKYHLPAKIAHARFVLCISDYCRSQLMRISAPEHWAKMHVVRLGVDPQLFAPNPQNRKSGQPFEIVCVGRLVPAKGQLLLVRAFAQLLSEGYAAHLTLVGDGEDRGRIEAMIAERGLAAGVTLKGALSHAHARQALRQADLFVLASFAEGLPVALMEAMSMEIACISTYVAGIPELIRHEQDGLLVPASSVEALAQAMRDLIDNPGYRHTLAASGRMRALSLHNLSQNAAEQASVIERYLAQSA
jgi:colanic acid/amylovoran biosynthesis glycosyltransferase